MEGEFVSLVVMEFDDVLRVILWLLGRQKVFRFKNRFESFCCYNFVTS